MAVMHTKAPVTNQRVADDLGITHSMVSRVRSGDRYPSLDLMRKIDEVFHWPIGTQVVHDLDRYAGAFEAELERHYAEG